MNESKRVVITGGSGLVGSALTANLTAAGHEPSAIRLGVFAGHYRSDRDWSDQVLTDAETRLARWRTALETPGPQERACELVQGLRARLADDLDTPGALKLVDDWAAALVTCDCR